MYEEVEEECGYKEDHALHKVAHNPSPLIVCRMEKTTQEYSKKGKREEVKQYHPLIPFQLFQVEPILGHGLLLCIIV